MAQVIVLRHSLFALQNHDVMAADFSKVVWVTFAILASIVALMVGLDAAGVAQVRDTRAPRASIYSQITPSGRRRTETTSATVLLIPGTWYIDGECR